MCVYLQAALFLLRLFEGLAPYQPTQFRPVHSAWPVAVAVHAASIALKPTPQSQPCTNITVKTQPRGSHGGECT